jgi:NADPH:quinone reductase-like Zn-dependent oxidoreductase
VQEAPPGAVAGRLPEDMLAARNSRFGPPGVVRLERVAIPTRKRGQVLVRVHATTVSTADGRLRARNAPRGFGVVMGLMFGFTHPRYQALGTEISGEVVAADGDACTYREGDRIVADLGTKLGGHAQYVIVGRRTPTALIPGGVSWTDAAAVIFGGITALAFLRDKLKIRPGEQLLVIGAGGAVGSAAVQLGRLMGAEVTGVCSSGKRGHVHALGAHRVIDYRATDWRREPRRYDAILDTVGGTTFGNGVHALTAAGRLGLVVADLPLMLSSAWISATRPHTVHAGPVAAVAADLHYLLSLCADRRFKPLIGAVLPLARIVEAHQRVDSGHKLGSIVIDMATG